ncbi:MAG: aminopeptidase P N-terminal domain-containing protein [Candidatus Obscuribacterales bacterium]|nr:aminopeptidase P N-terminal domain-containing protein [Candidatus Obscuribacterales bacterium]
MAKKAQVHVFKQPKRPLLAADVFARRRKEFLRRMPANSVAIIVTSPERTRSNDTEYQYRPASDVLYLSNFHEPEAALVFVKDGEGKGRFLMFVRPKDRAREIWTGIRQGPEGAVSKFGADEAFNVEDFEKVVRPLLAECERVYYKFRRDEHFDKIFRSMWEDNQRDLLNPETIIHEMRLFKSAEEVEMMRYAGKVSAEAHCEAMRLVRPGMMEYQLQASMEAVFKFNGALYPAYTSIVGGGANAVILHYVENNCELKDGDLVLIDAACEYQGYASDITRTFPVNGKFSKAQREIYEVVLAAEKAGIAMARPGAKLQQVHDRASEVLREGLVKLGILPKTHLTVQGEKKALDTWKKEGSKGVKPLTLHDFFMHGTSHFIGMDVHDVGTGGTRDPRGKKRALKPGMAFTVEPGIYIAPGEERVAAKYRGIGIRIEDDVVITADGCEVLTSAVPKDVDAIEKLMAEGRAHCLDVEKKFAVKA